MKASTTILCALALVAGLATASADQTSQKDSKTSAKAEKSSSGKTAKQKYQPQTGSRTGRTVYLDGRITDGPYQLIVITQDSIRNSGYSTVSQVLSRNGLRR